jgi:hypothetical protein
VPTVRERASDALLRTAIDLGADRESMVRSMTATRADQRAYEQAQSTLLLAGWVDSLLLWLSARLRPRPHPR